MEEYHKIETLFERDDKTKKMIVGKFRNPTIEYLQNNIWEFSEKINGTNIRVIWDGHEVIFKGRTDKAQIPTPLLNRLKELFSGEVNAQMFEQKFGETEVMLVGEGYGPGIQSGGSYRDSVDFILFDVKIAGNYQPRESVEDIANYFGIDIAPIILVGTLWEAIEYVRSHPKSLVAKNGAYMEGLVGRTLVETLDRCGKRNIVKIKWEDFKPE